MCYTAASVGNSRMGEGGFACCRWARAGHACTLSLALPGKPAHWALAPGRWPRVLPGCDGDRWAAGMPWAGQTIGRFRLCQPIAWHVSSCPDLVCAQPARANTLGSAGAPAPSRLAAGQELDLKGSCSRAASLSCSRFLELINGRWSLGTPQGRPGKPPGPARESRPLRAALPLPPSHACIGSPFDSNGLQVESRWAAAAPASPLPPRCRLWGNPRRAQAFAGLFHAPGGAQAERPSPQLLA